ncbi:MAG: hypothetical protein JJU40_06750, partial [Rhodobacteraceae bacterium]|nr:hypothetical protein [Paracoccaceae bacterium]
MHSVDPRPEPLPPTRWHAPGASRPDCESAILLRSHLGPVFARAASWEALGQALIRRGIRPHLGAGGLLLRQAATGEPVCDSAFLGHPLEDLVARWGRPPVLARAGAR